MDSIRESLLVSLDSLQKSLIQCQQQLNVVQHPNYEKTLEQLQEYEKQYMSLRLRLAATSPELANQLTALLDSDEVILNNLITLVSQMRHNTTLDFNTDSLHSSLIQLPPQGRMFTEVHDELRRWAELFDLDADIRESKFEPELNRLLSHRIPDLVDGLRTNVNRFDCAAIIAQSFFLGHVGGVKKLDFQEIKQNAATNNTMKHKLLALLFYFYKACNMIRHNFVNFNTLISITKFRLDFNSIQMYSNTNLVSLKDVKMTVYRPEEDVDSTAELHDIIAIHSVGELGATSLTANLSHEDVQFMRYPELYVTKFFNDKATRTNESLYLNNFIRYNNLSIDNNTVAFVTTAADQNDFEVLYVNFINFTSTILAPHDELAGGVLDKSVIDDRIAKLASGLYNYRAAVGPYTSVFFITGPYGARQNRIFQFLLELLVCCAYNIKIYYIAADYETYMEIKQTLESLPSNTTVSKLYTALLQYNLNVQAVYNLTNSLTY